MKVLPELKEMQVRINFFLYFVIKILNHVGKIRSIFKYVKKRRAT